MNTCEREKYDTSAGLHTEAQSAELPNRQWYSPRRGFVVQRAEDRSSINSMTLQYREVKSENQRKNQLDDVG